MELAEAITLTRVQTITPFPAEALPLAWEWLNEHPEHNFDDYGSKTCDEFVQEMLKRSEMESSWGVLDGDGNLCGIVGYLPLTERLGTFHGICFADRVCGTAITHQAIESILNQLWALGVEKISASFFADNERIHRFLQAHGAVDEGLLRKNSMRNGLPIDSRVVAIFREDS